MEDHNQLFKLFANIHNKIRQDLDNDAIDCDAVIKILCRQIEMCEKLENNSMLSTIHNLLGQIAIYSHNNLKALFHYEKGVDYAYKSGDDFIVVISLNNIAETLQRLGLYYDSIDLLKKSRQYADKLNKTVFVAVTFINEARAQLELGNSAEAIYLAHKAKELFDNEEVWTVNIKNYLPHLYAILAMAYADVDHPELAWKFVERTYEFASGFAEKIYMYIAKYCLAYVQLAYPRDDLCTFECLEDAIDECKKFGKKVELVQSLSWKSEYLRSMGELEDANQLDMILQDLIDETNYRNLGSR